MVVYNSGMGQIGGLSFSGTLRYVPPEIKARQVLEARWDGRLPVDVKGIAESVGLRVIEDQIEWSGIARYADDHVGEVIVRKSDPSYRKRFTIAHEIGHFLLEHVSENSQELRDQTQNYSLTFFDPKEVAANKFAAELLMPADVVHKVFMMTTSDDVVSEMADKFGVSKQAIKIRLKMVGLLPRWA